MPEFVVVLLALALLEFFALAAGPRRRAKEKKTGAAKTDAMILRSQTALAKSPMRMELATYAKKAEKQKMVVLMHSTHSASALVLLALPESAEQCSFGLMDTATNLRLCDVKWMVRGQNYLKFV